MARADLTSDGLILLHTAWNEKEQARSVLGSRWDHQAKVWTYPLSWSTCVQLRGTFGDALEVGAELAEWSWPARERVEQLRTMRGWLEPPPDFVLAPARGRYGFQSVGSEFLIQAAHALLADEMGTGKTVQVLTALEDLVQAMALNGPALVVCPASIKLNWAREAVRWAPSFMPFVVSGGAVARRKTWAAARLAMEAGNSVLVIVNYELARTMTRLSSYGSVALRRCRECDPKHGEEGLTPGRCQVHRKELDQVDWAAVIVDEAHRIKDPKSHQTRAVWSLGADRPGFTVYRWALTGTPIANHPGDLWPILRWLRPTEFPGWTAYVNRYCQQDWNGFGGLDIVGLRPERRDEFHSVVDYRMRRVLKSQVLQQLPPKLRETRWVEMGSKQRKAYDQLATGLVAGGVDGGPKLVAPNAMVAALRMMQFASATCAVRPDPDAPDDVQRWTVELTEPSSKLDELDAVLEELGPKPVAICAQSRKLIELAAARLIKRGERVGLITGAVGQLDRDAALTAFQAGQLNRLLFTISAGGVGLTMTAADTLIFLQRSWSMVDNRQAEDRVHRLGAEVHPSVTIIDLITQESIEEDQVGRIQTKLLRLDEITRDRATATHQAEIDDLDAAERMTMANIAVPDALATFGGEL